MASLSDTRVGFERPIEAGDAQTNARCGSQKKLQVSLWIAPRWQEEVVGDPGAV